MPGKKVVLVGHCGPDSSYLSIAVSSAVQGTVVLMADDDSTLKKMLASGVDLLLFNRQLDYGFPTDEGVQLIRDLRPQYPDLKMILVSNFDDAQRDAVTAGAQAGFGKREIGTPRVKQLLRDALQ